MAAAPRRATAARDEQGNRLPSVGTLMLSKLDEKDSCRQIVSVLHTTRCTPAAGARRALRFRPRRKRRTLLRVLPPSSFASYAINSPNVACPRSPALFAFQFEAKSWIVGHVMDAKEADKSEDATAADQGPKRVEDVAAGAADEVGTKRTAAKACSEGLMTPYRARRRRKRRRRRARSRLRQPPTCWPSRRCCPNSRIWICQLT